LAYAIGVAEPVSVMVDTYGTGSIDDESLSEAVKSVFPTRPGLFSKELDLLRPIYQKTASYGHFGRNDADFTWESTDKVELLKAHFTK